MSASFTPFGATLGGVLIGIAATLLWVLNGRTAGVSGIIGGALRGEAGDFGWRVAFLLGLSLSGFVGMALSPGAFEAPTLSLPLLAVAGLLVGVGTRLGGGCTSGHGVCGLSRGSSRSLVATLTFVATAVLTVAVVRHLAGGG